MPQLEQNNRTTPTARMENLVLNEGNLVCAVNCDQGFYRLSTSLLLGRSEEYNSFLLTRKFVISKMLCYCILLRCYPDEMMIRTDIDVFSGVRRGKSEREIVG